MAIQNLEDPECELGYTEEQLERILGDRYQEFNFWMSGQTMSICDGRAYNYNLKKYEPTGCGPHGVVVYSWDLDRFLNNLPIID